MHKLTIVGEAAGKLSVEVRGSHPAVRWTHAKRFRDRNVHVYYVVDWDIVWKTAKEDLPRRRVQVAEILENEFS